MTIHTTTQICGMGSPIRIYRHSDHVLVEIGSGHSSITMEPKHVRQLVAALDTFMAEEDTSQVSA